MNHTFKKIIFLEGLPNVGKTTIVNYIKSNYKNIIISDEIMSKKILNHFFIINQYDYFKNDNMKFYRQPEKNSNILLIDRGYISTYCYNIVKSLIQNNYKNFKILKKIGNKFKIFQHENVEVIYLKSYRYLLPYCDINDPYGNKDNQKLLQEISLFICKKYVKNLKIYNYNYLSDFKEIINEIIN